MERSNLIPYVFIREKALQKVLEVLGIFIELNKYMEIHECQRSRFFFDFCHSDFYSFIYSLKLLGQLKPNFIWSLHRSGEQNSSSKGHGHMIKMAAMPIYGKNR